MAAAVRQGWLDGEYTLPRMEEAVSNHKFRCAVADRHGCYYHGSIELEASTKVQQWTLTIYDGDRRRTPTRIVMNQGDAVALASALADYPDPSLPMGAGP